MYKIIHTPGEYYSATYSSSYAASTLDVTFHSNLLAGATEVRQPRDRGQLHHLIWHRVCACHSSSAGCLCPSPTAPRQVTSPFRMLR